MTFKEETFEYIYLQKLYDEKMDEMFNNVKTFDYTDPLFVSSYLYLTCKQHPEHIGYQFLLANNINETVIKTWNFTEDNFETTKKEIIKYLTTGN